jgi:hypothetical protein
MAIREEIPDSAGEAVTVPQIQYCALLPYIAGIPVWTGFDVDQFSGDCGNRNIDTLVGAFGCMEQMLVIVRACRDGVILQGCDFGHRHGLGGCANLKV